VGALAKSVALGAGDDAMRIRRDEATRREQRNTHAIRVGRYLTR
jgi:hypothetical protein